MGNRAVAESRQHAPLIVGSKALNQGELMSRLGRIPVLAGGYRQTAMRRTLKLAAGGPVGAFWLSAAVRDLR